MLKLQETLLHSWFCSLISVISGRRIGSCGRDWSVGIAVCLQLCIHSRSNSRIWNHSSKCYKFEILPEFDDIVRNYQSHQSIGNQKSNIEKLRSISIIFSTELPRFCADLWIAMQSTVFGRFVENLPFKRGWV